MDSYVARDSRYIGIAFASNGVEGRSAERERKTLQPSKRHYSSDPAHPRVRLVTHRQARVPARDEERW